MINIICVFYEEPFSPPLSLTVCVNEIHIFPDFVIMFALEATIYEIFRTTRKMIGHFV